MSKPWRRDVNNNRHKQQPQQQPTVAWRRRHRSCNLYHPLMLIMVLKLDLSSWRRLYRVHPCLRHLPCRRKHTRGGRRREPHALLLFSTEHATTKPSYMNHHHTASREKRNDRFLPFLHTIFSLPISIAYIGFFSFFRLLPLFLDAYGGLDGRTREAVNLLSRSNR